MHTIKLRLTPQEAHQDALLRTRVAQELRINPKEISTLLIRKHSIDARQRTVFVDITLEVYTQGEQPKGDNFQDIHYSDVSDAPSVVVVGAGPCGLFAALRLIELGLRPIVLERGEDVMTRRKTLSTLHKTGILNPESNYSYGEGGAGAFSDGKLYTRSKKRGSVERILRIFCQHGADHKILVDAHPHIGTDKLPSIIRNIRERIIVSGGEVHFSTKVVGLLIDKDQVHGAISEQGEEFSGPVILATGHSARDIYRYLHGKGIYLEAKPIAVGVRLEHPQKLIDTIRYHSPNGRGQWLPAAEYVYKTQIDGRGVYSFCMCPGGFVVPASTDWGQTVVNGMSPANRGSKWANSGMVVELGIEDIAQTGIEVEDPTSPLALMHWCEIFEQMSYQAANNTLKAPAQRMTDFVQHRASSSLPPTSYNMGLTANKLQDWMPHYITSRLEQGFLRFEHQTPGFLTEEAQLIGVESRTSSPVRIPRDRETYQHLYMRGLYPAGEGAGYAGGIVSAAIDGENVAEAIARTMLLG